jgi:saccharopine dehydrogenase-like NADP-dependent oxidoreductase
MRILCLGAGGRISRESVKDLVGNTDFSRITIGDVNEAAAREVAGEIGDARCDVIRFDITDSDRFMKALRRATRLPDQNRVFC